MIESRIEKISKRQKRPRTKITIQFKNGRKEIAPASEEMMMMTTMMIYELLLLLLLPLQGKKPPIFQGHRKSCPECYTTMFLAKKNLQPTKSRPRSSRKEHKADDVKTRRRRRKARNPDDLLCDKTQMRTQHKERQKNGREETAETGYTENPPVLDTIQ
jgi:hypothetical protein